MISGTVRNSIYTPITDLPALISMAFLTLACLVFGVLSTYVILVLDRAAVSLIGANGAGALVPPFFGHHGVNGELPQKFLAEFHDLGAQIGHRTMQGRGLVVMHRGNENNPVVFAMSTSYMFVALIFLLGVSAGVIWFIFARRRKVEKRPV
jgi:hypothetical protein